jgi:MATE family multidrug resistance protein
MTRSLDAKIWAIAWPAILANLSIPLLGLVDAALLGHLDSPRYLGAVAIGSAVLSFLYWGFSFLRMGTTGEVARAVGASDRSAATLALARAAVLALTIAVLLWLFRHSLLRLGLELMGAEAQVSGLAQRYALLRLLSAPAVLLTYTVVGWCIGHQDTRWPMRILIVTNAANILLDWWFIVILGWASEGAALATVLAEYLGLAVAVAALRTRSRALQFDRQLGQALARWRPYRALLSSNLNLFLRTCALLFAFAYFTAAGEKLGAATLAANAVMMQFLLFAAFALDGFAYAAEGMAGQALGRRDLASFRTVVRRCAWWSGLSALLISLLILLGRPWLFPLLSDLAPVQAVMREQGLWLVLLPLAAAPSYLLDGVFIGAGATRAMMVSMLLSVTLVYLPVWELTRPLGNHGLWLAFTLFNLSRGLILGGMFAWFSRRYRWLGPPSDLPG